jgi:beta-lactamase class A
MPLRLALVSFALVAFAHGQTMGVDLLEAKLKEKIRVLDRNLDGALGVAVIDLTSGRTILLNADTPFATASVIKVPILVEIFRQARAGELSLQERLTVEPS